MCHNLDLAVVGDDGDQLEEDLARASDAEIVGLVEGVVLTLDQVDLLRTVYEAVTSCGAVSKKVCVCGCHACSLGRGVCSCM
jgi:hypothetical protein